MVSHLIRIKEIFFIINKIIIIFSASRMTVISFLPKTVHSTLQALSKSLRRPSFRRQRERRITYIKFKKKKIKLQNVPLRTSYCLHTISRNAHYISHNSRKKALCVCVHVCVHIYLFTLRGHSTDTQALDKPGTFLLTVFHKSAWHVSLQNFCSFTCTLEHTVFEFYGASAIFSW